MTSTKDNTVKVLALVIVLSTIVVGGAFGLVIVNNNMQRDNQAAQQAAEDKKKADEVKSKQAQEAFVGLQRNACLKSADDSYWVWVKLNATSTKDTGSGPVYFMPQDQWDYAAAQKKTAVDDCYRQYPN